MEFRMVKSLQEEEPLCNEQNLLVNNKNKDTTAVDFIYCLPFELVPLVFHSFPIQDLFECMNVNALWKCRILNSPTLWHQMTIMKDEEETFIPKLILVGSYIKSYNIIDGCEKTHRSSMDLIASECLSHLQSLVIHEAGYYFHGSTNDLLVQSIHHLRHTLTELELTWYKRDNGTIATATSMHQLPTLASILSACPGLRRIRMDMPAFRNVDNNNDTTNPFSPLLLLPSSTSKHDCSSWQLTHLHWSIGSSSNSIINNNNNMIKTTQLEVESILSTCPSLTYLKIDPCEEPISLLSIYKKCPPALRFLGLNAEKQYDIFEKYWNGDNDDYYYDGSHSTISSNSGIKALVIPCLDETDWVNLIRTLMMDDQKQLQELVILHDHLYMLNLPQLLQVYHGKQLHLRHTGQRKQYISTVKACVEIIPLLQSASNVANDYYWNDKSQQQKPHQIAITSIFCRDYMAQCPWFINQLKRIGSSNSNNSNISLLPSPSMTTASLTLTQCFILDSCLRHLLDGGFPYLQELYIDNCVLQSTTLTDLIVGLATASSASSDRNNANNNEETGQVEQQSSPQCLPPRMKHLSFGSIPGLTDELVATLAAIPSLKQVTLSCCYSVTDQGVRDLVDKSSTTLEQVVIHDCKQVSNDTTHYIQEKLSNRIHQYHDGKE